MDEQQHVPTRMKTLIIGYGNQSRRDDGVGWFVIEQLAALKLPGVELETGQQLEIESAEIISGYDNVIFVDAAIPEAPEPIQRTVVTPNFQSHAVAHYMTPADVLSLCKTLHGREPRAVLFSIRGRDFNFGTTLTPEVEQAAREVVKQIVEIIRSGGSFLTRIGTNFGGPSSARPGGTA
jgi:hydrogenase maturation protease